jgi:hypothetical protein
VAASIPSRIFLKIIIRKSLKKIKIISKNQRRALDISAAKVGEIIQIDAVVARVAYVDFQRVLAFQRRVQVRAVMAMA